MIDRLEAIFADGKKKGQIIGGDPRDLAMWYLTAAVGLMMQDTSMIEGYRLPDADFLLRLIVK